MAMGFIYKFNCFVLLVLRLLFDIINVALNTIDGEFLERKFKEGIYLTDVNI